MKYKESVADKSLVDPQKLENLCCKILCKVGVSKDDALYISSVMVRTDLRGREAHGVIRIGDLIKKIEEGLLNPLSEIKIVKDNEAVSVVDGCYGIGYVIGSKVMDLAINKANQYGVGIVGVKNSSFFGTTDYLAEIAAKKKMIGIVSTNAGPNMAPWGGTTISLGTNPFAISVPTSKEECPIILDMATSVVGKSKILLAKKMGEKIPIGWALNKYGENTTDPEEACNGFVLPVGGYKGYGLSLMVDIFSGVLTGGLFGKDAIGPYTFKKGGVGHFVQAINIQHFMDYNDFLIRIEKRIKQIKDSELAPGYERIFLPGERAYESEMEKRENGLPLRRKTIDDLILISKKFNIKHDFLNESL